MNTFSAVVSIFAVLACVGWFMAITTTLPLPMILLFLIVFYMVVLIGGLIGQGLITLSEYLQNLHGQTND